MTEAEAMAIRFTIDHFEPRWARPDLLDEYSNLMYACDECNLRKGDLVPPPVARENGVRFFRPDVDRHEDHFKINGIRVESKTQIAKFSIEAIDLNRAALRKLRGIRQRLTRCDEMIAAGVLGLKRFHIDQLPPEIKRLAATTIRRAVATADRAADDIDELLRDYAKSPLLDNREDEETVKERSANLADWKMLFPGNWRAPRVGAKSGRTKKSGK